MDSIAISFDVGSLGRVDFRLYVMTGDFKSFESVEFKLDSGSDFTTISCDSLSLLGYSREFLQSCPHHHNIASAAAGTIRLQYIPNVSIKFADREIQGCRIFFALDTGLRSLFGSDILKHFNLEVNYDMGLFRLTRAEYVPQLSSGEMPVRVYSLGYE